MVSFWVWGSKRFVEEKAIITDIYDLLAVSTRPPDEDLSRFALYCLGPAGLCQEYY